MEKTHIAVAGAGAIGLAHIAVLRRSSSAVLSAVVDPAPAAADAARQAGVPHYTSLDDLFHQQRPDGVILATPNKLHVDHALQCISAGVPCLLEKPIAASVAQALTLVREIDTVGAKVLIGHHRAYSPIMAKARQVVQSGQLGRLVAVMGSATFFKPDRYFEEAPWRREVGAGPILINMIHEVHNLRTLCGDIVAVQAFASNAARGNVVEDTAAINLRFANGALGTFMLSDTAASARSWEQTSMENKAYATHPDEDCYVIAGTQGSLSVPTMRIKTYPSSQDRSWFKPFEEGVVGMVRDDPLALQLKHFEQMVREQVQPLVSARDGLANLLVTEAIAEAARTGRVVEVKNP